MPTLSLKALNEELNKKRIFLNASEILKIFELAQKETQDSQRKESDLLIVFEKMKHLAAEEVALQSTEIPFAFTQEILEKTPELFPFFNDAFALRFSGNFLNDFVTEINQAAEKGEISQEVATVIRGIQPQAFVPVIQQAAAAAVSPHPVPQPSAAPQQTVAPVVPQPHPSAPILTLFNWYLAAGTLYTVNTHCKENNVSMTERDSLTVMRESFLLARHHLAEMTKEPRANRIDGDALLKLSLLLNNNNHLGRLPEPESEVSSHLNISFR